MNFQETKFLTRRHFLRDTTTGLTGVALMHLLNHETLAQQIQHHAPKAKQVLQIFCPGAASHIDLWDDKPALEKYHGTPLPGAGTEVTFQGKNGNLMKSPWPFAPADGNPSRTEPVAINTLPGPCVLLRDVIE